MSSCKSFQYLYRPPLRESRLPCNTNGKQLLQPYPLFVLETNITFSKYVFQKCFSYFENNSPPKWVSKNDFSIDVIACFTTLLPSKNIFFYIFNINFSIIIIRSLFQNFNALHEKKKKYLSKFFRNFK